MFSTLSIFSNHTHNTQIFLKTTATTTTTNNTNVSWEAFSVGERAWAC